ncbi:MAG: tripartite tricarboxylate transporter TctB family protein [Ferrovibrio sp.]|uniref:tripartite tricarboxylate transporter TctB family protein n=1 Tax=Ferrovibrio sp. TaxID=1917215 RepID=UPI00391CB885
MRINDAIFGILLFGLSLFIGFHAAGFPKMPGTAYGPAFFPQVLAAGLGICAVLLILRGIVALRQGAALVVLSPWMRMPGRWMGAMLMLACVVAYTLLDDMLGFHLAGMAVTLVFMLYLGVRPLYAVGFSLGAVIVIWLLFARLLLVPLPGGVLTGLLW